MLVDKAFLHPNKSAQFSDFFYNKEDIENNCEYKPQRLIG